MSDVDQANHSRVGDPVVDHPMLAASFDEAAPPEAGEVVRDLRLGKTEAANDLSDRKLPFGAEQLEDTETSRVAEASEVLGHEVSPRGNSGEPERS